MSSAGEVERIADWKDEFGRMITAHFEGSKSCKVRANRWRSKTDFDIDFNIPKILPVITEEEVKEIDPRLFGTNPIDPDDYIERTSFEYHESNSVRPFGKATIFLMLYRDQRTIEIECMNPKQFQKQLDKLYPPMLLIRGKIFDPEKLKQGAIVVIKNKLKVGEALRFGMAEYSDLELFNMNQLNAIIDGLKEGLIQEVLKATEEIRQEYSQDFEEKVKKADDEIQTKLKQEHLQMINQRRKLHGIEEIDGDFFLEHAEAVAKQRHIRRRKAYTMIDISD